MLSRRSGAAEVLRSAPTVEPGDAAGLAEAILTLLERPDLWTRHAAAGRAEAAGLTWDRAVAALEGVAHGLTRSRVGA